MAMKVRGGSQYVGVSCDKGKRSRHDTRSGPEGQCQGWDNNYGNLTVIPYCYCPGSIKRVILPSFYPNSECVRVWYLHSSQQTRGDALNCSENTDSLSSHSLLHPHSFTMKVKHKSTKKIFYYLYARFQIMNCTEEPEIRARRCMKEDRK